MNNNSSALQRRAIENPAIGVIVKNYPVIGI
jgi:hypothetical protein